LPGGKQPASGVQIVPQPGARNDASATPAPTGKPPATGDNLPTSNAVRPVEPAKTP
jgi:hypothetical protein